VLAIGAIFRRYAPEYLTYNLLEVLGVSILPLSMIVVFDIWIVQRIWYCLFFILLYKTSCTKHCRRYTSIYVHCIWYEQINEI